MSLGHQTDLLYSEEGGMAGPASLELSRLSSVPGSGSALLPLGPGKPVGRQMSPSSPGAAVTLGTSTALKYWGCSLPIPRANGFA
jgi:hypothetical protein